jgi:hypothetical protein
MILRVQNNSYQLRVLPMKDRDRVRRRYQRLFDAAIVRPEGLDLSRLHSSLFSLEKELTTLQFGGETSPDAISISAENSCGKSRREKRMGSVAVHHGLAKRARR